MIDDRAVEAACDAWYQVTGSHTGAASMLAALAAAAPFLTQIPDGCLNVGHQVVKTKGYPFPGEVRAVFKTRAGFVRYVVEATGEDYRGMLHIFDATQLALPPPPQERTDG